MIEKIKEVLNLTKIFFKNSFQNPYIIDKKTNKLDKKSVFVWAIIIVMIAISYLSYEIIKVLVGINLSIVFLNIFFLILNIIMIFQVVLASTNIYFFSKDLELMLPLPIKSENLLIAKFNTILINLYFTELVFAIFPLMIYGILTDSGIVFYLYLIIILLIFPILVNLIISIIMMLLMKLSRFIKNKDVFQIIITLFFLLFIFLLEFKVTNNIVTKIDDDFSLENREVVETIDNFSNKMRNINKYFIEINPTVDILNNYNKVNSILYLIEIIFIDFIFLLLFILIGKRYYLKNILRTNNNFYIRKLNKNYLETKLKKMSQGNSYVKKEMKILFKNPIFFMQCIFPTLILIISLIIIIVIGLPNLKALLTSDIFGEEIQFSIDLGVICLLLAIIQIIFTMSNISISAISREGKNAIYMKFIPIDFYKQFNYKAIPQVLVNMIFIFIVVILTKLLFPNFEFIYLIFLFILSNLLNILNSKLMVLMDFIKPNLNWKADYEAIKQNNNKLFQYALTIIIVLLLMYFNSIFSKVNLFLSCFLISTILIILIFIFNKIIKFNINKLFRKIN